MQAAHDALPTSGGEVTLSPDTTYLLTASLIISKPNADDPGIVLEHDHSAHGWHERPSSSRLRRRRPGSSFEM